MHKIDFTLPKVLLIFVSLKYQATVKLLSYRSDIFKNRCLPTKVTFLYLTRINIMNASEKKSLCLLKIFRLIKVSYYRTTAATFASAMRLQRGSILLSCSPEL